MRADIMRALDGRSVLAPAVAAGEETQAFPPPTTDPAPTAETSAYHTEDRQESGRRTGLWILLGLLVLAAIAAAAFYFFNTGGDDVRQAEVPNLQGKTLAEAEQLLEDANLDVGQESAVASDEKKGTVLRQSETPGSLVDEGTEVDITYSGGPKTAIVPSVTDMNLQQATEALEARKFEVVPVEDDKSTEPKNQVTSTDPAAGEKVPSVLDGQGLLLDRLPELPPASSVLRRERRDSAAPRNRLQVDPGPMPSATSPGQDRRSPRSPAAPSSLRHGPSSSSRSRSAHPRRRRPLPPRRHRPTTTTRLPTPRPRVPDLR